MNKTIVCLLLMLCGTVGTALAQIPKATLRDIDGRAVSTDTLRNNGKPFVIDFFATWCKPCLRELDAISEVYDDWQRETGMKIFAVSIDQAQNTNKVRPLVEQKGWTYDVLLDPNADFRRAFGGQIIPFVVVCDGSGKIVYQHNGYAEGAETEILDKLKELAGK